MTAEHLRMVPGRPRLALTAKGEGQVILFLHGIGGNRTNWRTQIDEFGQDHKAAAWDLRGYGDSEDYDGPMTFADLRADLARTLDFLEAERAILVGLSLGGRIALDFAAERSDRVSQLILADTSAGSDEMNSEEKIQEFLAQRLKPLRAGLTPADTAPKLRDRLAGPDASEEAREEIRASLAAQRSESYAKTLEGAVRYQHFEPEKISVPTLVLTGENDVMAPPAVAETLAKRIDRAKFKVIPTAG
ncbi:MAG: alpha/beta hydrolase, partial [Parvularcula sp.]|nr:alpha/beta hydrolase [Parvularcula sp.]